MATNEVVLHGGGEHGRVVLSCLKDAGFTLRGVFDPKSPVSINGVSWLGPYDPGSARDAQIIHAIGDNKVRKEAVSRSAHAPLILVHPTAYVAETARLEEGAMVLQGVIIQDMATIGKHAILNTGCSVDHDCQVGDFAHVAPGAVLCGNVTISEGCLIGAGSVIIPGMKVGEWSVVGAGSVVIDHVPAFSIVAGNPAKVIKSLAR